MGDIKDLQNAVRPILETIRNEHFREGYREAITDKELLGILVAKFMEWTGSDIALVAHYAFEDSNYSRVAAEMADLAENLS